MIETGLKMYITNLLGICLINPNAYNPFLFNSLAHCYIQYAALKAKQPESLSECCSMCRSHNHSCSTLSQLVTLKCGSVLRKQTVVSVTQSQSQLFYREPAGVRCKQAARATPTDGLLYFLPVALDGFVHLVQESRQEVCVVRSEDWMCSECTNTRSPS